MQKTRWDFIIPVVLRSSYKREMKLQGFYGKVESHLSASGLAEVRCFSSYKQALIVFIVKVNFGCCFLTRVGDFFYR